MVKVLKQTENNPGLNDYGNFITPEQAAKAINCKAVSGHLIRELCKKGIIEHINPPGTSRIYLIKPGSIKAWLDKGKVSGKF